MIILEALWFFLPAGIGNMAPVIANKIPLLNRWNLPLDFGLSIGNSRVFGANKTWRGLLFGIVCAGAFSVGQFYVYAPLIDSVGSAFVLGMMLGGGALLGDAVASFFKRRLDIPSGTAWIPFDQTDYIIGGLLLVLPFASHTLSSVAVASILIVYTGLHFLVSYIGYLLGLKQRPV